MIDGDGIVGVDAFLIADVEMKLMNVGVLVKGVGGAAGDVFDEARIFVGLHGDVAFIGALEERVDGCTGALAEEGEKFCGGNSGAAFLPFGFDGNPTALAVGAVVADFSAAWAECGDGYTEGVADAGS